MSNKLIIGVILLLVACGNPPALEPPPTPHPIVISYLPSLQPVTPALIHCVEQIPETVIFLEEVPYTSIQDQTSDLLLWMGEPMEDGRYASPLVREEFVVIINPENPLDKIDRDDLRAIYTGRMENWEDIAGIDSQISIWAYPMENEVQEIFSEVILEGNKISSLAHLAPGAQEMLESVSSDPAAIGVIPKAWLDDSVEELPFSGSSLHQPVFVLSKGEPQGKLRELVACLQSQAGMDMLLDEYSAWE
jgi:phosphate transport system substrate-binding protein